MAYINYSSKLYGNIVVLQSSVITTVLHPYAFCCSFAPPQFTLGTGSFRVSYAFLNKMSGVVVILQRSPYSLRLHSHCAHRRSWRPTSVFLPREATRSAVLRRQVVRPFVCL